MEKNESEKYEIKDKNTREMLLKRLAQGGVNEQEGGRKEEECLMEEKSKVDKHRFNQKQNINGM